MGNKRQRRQQEVKVYKPQKIKLWNCEKAEEEMQDFFIISQWFDFFLDSTGGFPEAEEQQKHRQLHFKFNSFM